MWKWKNEKKKGLPDLSEALLSCHTVNQKRCNTYYFLCFVRKRQYMHTDYASSSPYVDDGVSLNVVHVGVAEAQLSATSLSGADDSRSNRVLEGKRAADGDHELPWSEVWWAAQQQHRKLRLQGRRTDVHITGGWSYWEKRRIHEDEKKIQVT